MLDRILQLIFAHIDFDRRHGRRPLSAFTAAPKRFWDAFGKARPLQLAPPADQLSPPDPY